MALVGPQSSGKTTLLESILFTCGDITRKGQVEGGSTVSDVSAEARAHHMSTELTAVSAHYLSEEWVFLDCPGAIDLGWDSQAALAVCDLAVVVVDPDPTRLVTIAPLLKALDDNSVPHIIFINKLDSPGVKVRDVIAAIQTHSGRPLALRHVPIRDGETITGYVDLLAQRAYHYQLDRPSERVDLDDVSTDRVTTARQELLEILSDFDDGLLEQLLEDIEPDAHTVYESFKAELANDHVVPVMLGAASQNNGIVRLLKSLRHDCPTAEVTADRLMIQDGDPVASIFKTAYQAHMGRISLARVWRGTLADGGHLAGEKITGLTAGTVQELGKSKRAKAAAGTVVALPKFEAGQAGDILTAERADASELWPDPAPPLYAQALHVADRKDDVKLTDSLRKLCEEDPSLVLAQVPETGELVLQGQGPVHLKLAVEKLQSKFGLEVTAHTPLVPYRETIRKKASTHTRFKRQSGGHGQFADIRIDVLPLPRGEGFTFTSKVVGGAVPRQYIPGVEHGVTDALTQGPLGFSVVDLSVTLTDGQHHAVDSSEQSFRICGSLAMKEVLPQCSPVLLEPIDHVTIRVPAEFTSKAQRMLTQRRAQIQGFTNREGWSGWEEITCLMPTAERGDLIIELRSLSLGVGTFETRFSHYQELDGREADQVVEHRKAALESA